MNFKILRDLARSYTYQTLYNRAKELNNIRLFNNDSDFSKVQIVFLSYLQMYSILHQEMQTETEYLNEEILNDWLRTEAYLLYRQQKHKKEDKKSDMLSHNDGAIIFKRPSNKK